MNDDPRAEFTRRIETIEEAYEFMLAYAAQGQEEEPVGAEGIRGFLEGMEAALDGLGGIASASAGAGSETAAVWHDFIRVLAEEAARALAAVRLALAQKSIASQLIDNLNASIHVRTLLTDLFFIDEALKGTGGGAGKGE